MAFRIQDLLRELNPRRILLPIGLGLVVVSYMLYGNLTKVRYREVPAGTGDHAWVDLNHNGQTEDAEYVTAGPEGGNYQRITYRDVLSEINWTWASTAWIGVALLMMLLRDVAYMYRIRLLTDGVIKWRDSFNVIMLWEFASAVSPSLVGGTAVALFIINREGVNTGKSAAIVLTTALLDELFYVLTVPVVLLTVSTATLFPISLEKEFFGLTLGTVGIFVFAYVVLAVYSALLIWGVFINPRGLKWLVIKLASMPFLRRWRHDAVQMGDEIIAASREFRGRGIVFWLKAYGATVLSWTGRFWVVNFIILAFTPVGSHMLLYARQLVMFAILLLSPTPGGSGIAEFAFSGFFHDMIPIGLAASLALIWRLISYYPYLFIGTIVLPRWLKRRFGH